MNLTNTLVVVGTVTADLLGFSHITMSLEFTHSGAKSKKASSEKQFCRQKWLVDVRGQKRMTRLV